MAFNGIVAEMYILDILYCTVIDESWGVGVVNCKDLTNK